MHSHLKTWYDINVSQIVITLVAEGVGDILHYSVCFVRLKFQTYYFCWNIKILRKVKIILAITGLYKVIRREGNRKLSYPLQQSLHPNAMCLAII